MSGLPRSDEWPSVDGVLDGYSSVDVVEAVLRAFAAVAALVAVGVVVAVVGARVAFPYPLEWMEGGLVLHVRRVLHGEPLYVEPSVSFTPFIYPPLYVYASAGVSAVTGIGYLPLRLVSVASTLGCGALIALVVRGETRRVLPSVLSVGLFAATYPLVDTWFDLARVDMLFLFLALVVLAVFRFGRGAAAGVAAGVVFVLAALTKQSALVVFAPVAAYTVLTDRRLGVAFLATAGGLLGAATLLLQFLSDGWFLYYTFFLPSGHELVAERFVSFWTVDLLPVGIAAALGAGFLVHEHGHRPRIARFYALAAAGFVGAAVQARVHSGGWVNTLLPAYAIVAVLFGPGVDRALRVVPDVLGTTDRSSAGVARSAILVVVLVQFGALGYAPGEYVPSASDRERGEALEREFESLEEPAFSPIFPYIAVRAGHEPIAHKMALVDVLRAPPHDARRTLRSEVGRTMAAHRYGSLVLHDRDHPLAPFTRGYRYARTLGVYDNVAGVGVTPRYVFVPDRAEERRTAVELDQAAPAIPVEPGPVAKHVGGPVGGTVE